MEIGNNGSFFVSADAEWKTIDKGVQRKVLSYNKNLMLVHVRFEKGGIGKLHHHFHRQVSFIESGSFEVSIHDVRKVLKRGDTYIVEPEEVHGVVALEEGAIIDIFTPAREEFI
ncbi:MAG: cupin domain-containing protein [Chitinophagaceae bacterium]|nr:MAG: cupin domain-containing protein [Chitinophagaceae bacterium]